MVEQTPKLLKKCHVTEGFSQKDFHNTLIKKCIKRGLCARFINIQEKICFIRTKHPLHIA